MELSMRLEMQQKRLTNRDRLNDAFRRMRKTGLIARQNFACCGGCAAAELGAKAEAEGKAGVAYYHRQDAERIRRERNPEEHVYLGYGSPADGDEATIAIGRIVSKAVHAAGLDWEWDGDAAARIKVLLPCGLDGSA